MNTTDWPVARDGFWRLHWHIPRNKRTEPLLSVVVTEIRNDPPRANILAMSRGEKRADYKDVRVGDTVELAEKRWEVVDIDPGHMEGGWKSRDFQAGSVYLKLLGAAPAS